MTDIINQSTTSIVNSAVSNCAALNNASVVLNYLPNGNPCPGPQIQGNIIIDQKAGVNCTLSATDVTSITSNFQTAITSQAVQQAIQNSSSIQGWLAAAVSVQSSVATSNAQIISHVANYVSNNVQNNCTNIANALNNGTVYVCGGYRGNIVINQGASVVAMTTCIYQTIIQAFTSTTAWNDVAQAADQKLVSQQSGIGSFLIWIAVAFGILVILGIVAGIIYAIIKSKSKSSPTSTSDLLNLAQMASKSKVPVSAI